MFDLKPLSSEAIPAALEKAMRYRLLNEPMEAESICLDILEVDPDNQEALETLVLALTDQFPHRLSSAYAEAVKAVERLSNDYEKNYYSGIICERRGKAHLRQNMPDSGSHTHDWFTRAMRYYEKAEPLRPAGNDEVILRWNTCVRVFNRHPQIRATDELAPPIELE